MQESQQQRRGGTGLFHGSKETTPGSPMGIESAGGNAINGSPSASASKSAFQRSKAGDRNLCKVVRTTESLMRVPEKNGIRVPRSKEQTKAIEFLALELPTKRSILTADCFYNNQAN